VTKTIFVSAAIAGEGEPFFGSEAPHIAHRLTVQKTEPKKGTLIRGVFIVQQKTIVNDVFSENGSVNVIGCIVECSENIDCKFLDLTDKEGSGYELVSGKVPEAVKYATIDRFLNDNLKSSKITSVSYLRNQELVTENQASIQIPNNVIDALEN